MESQSKTFDAVKFEKEKAIARFNRLRAVATFWQIIEVAIAFAAVSWCSARVSLLELSTYVSNHHVVFLIGNAIIVSLLMLCRQSGSGGGGGSDAYDDYVKYSEAARALPPPPQRSDEEVAPAAVAEFGGDCGKQIVVAVAVAAAERTECDDVAAAIEKAARQIRRFQRTQSETLRREISVRPELRRSETVSLEAAEIENLSSEEFRRRVDAFIDEHWSKRAAKLEGNANYRS
ncbi:hypothetical protein C2S53_012305 [Perilla frutescens var. hirtella]|uniref:Uncharacterized protein n=1 Tax=Perilla frutescens var. hirtella TaxID=608512 RepID=A0AAD4IXT1_PERFH|nr:hypothetical protein C2S53_012305 [Perilla frutescens var. hirtella]